MNKIIGSIVIIVIILGAVFFNSNNHKTPVSEEEIKIGFSGPLTGPVAWLGELYLSGLTTAEQHINSNGGIDGRPVKLIVEDNGFTGKGGVDTFNTLKNKGAEIILSLGTVPSVPMSPLSKEEKIPLLAAATFVDLTIDNPFAIQMSILPENDVNATVVDMEKQGDKRIGVLYMNNEYGVSTLKAFKDRIKDSDVSVVIEEAFLPENPDFSTTILKIATSDIDAIYLIDLSFIRVMTELKLELNNRNKDVTVYLPASAYSSDNIVKHVDLFEGVHVVVSPVSIDGTKERDEFIRKLNLDKTNNQSLIHKAIGYDNLHIVADVLRKNPDTNKFAEEFSSFGLFKGAAGEYNLNSRYIGVSLVSAIFTKGKLQTVTD